jgi:hypothetical protein
MTDLSRANNRAIRFNDNQTVSSSSRTRYLPCRARNDFVHKRVRTGGLRSSLRPLRSRLIVFYGAGRR